MSEMALYGFEPSTYTQTALMTAREANLDPELKPLAFKKPSHFALHPYGKMPVLEHDDVTLFETLAIATYIDRVFGDSRLQPREPKTHARMLQWVSVAVDYAYEDLVNKLHADEPDDEAITAAAEQLKLLDGALREAPFFAGDEVSLADLFLFPMVAFAAGKMGAGALGKLASLKRWHAAMNERASVKKAH